MAAGTAGRHRVRGHSVLPAARVRPSRQRGVGEDLEAGGRLAAGSRGPRAPPSPGSPSLAASLARRPSLARCPLVDVRAGAARSRQPRAADRSRLLRGAPARHRRTSAPSPAPRDRRRPGRAGLHDPGRGAVASRERIEALPPGVRRNGTRRGGSRHEAAEHHLHRLGHGAARPLVSLRIREEHDAVPRDACTGNTHVHSCHVGRTLDAAIPCIHVHRPVPALAWSGFRGSTRREQTELPPAQPRLPNPGQGTDEPRLRVRRRVRELRLRGTQGGDGRRLRLLQRPVQPLVPHAVAARPPVRLDRPASLGASGLPLQDVHALHDRRRGQRQRAALDRLAPGAQPFFLFLNYLDAHFPHYPPRRLLDRFPAPAAKLDQERLLREMHAPGAPCARTSAAT